MGSAAGPGGRPWLEEDRLLVAMLETERPAVSYRLRGSFGTVGARRRRRRGRELVTRMVGRYPGLLEDDSPGLAELLLARSHRWESWEPFLLDRFSGGRSLSTLCLHLFHSFGLISHFRMDPADCYSFFRLVESGYRSGNPYHTALHAADVTQAIAVFVSQPRIARHLTRLELLAVLTAAVCHDLDHPGVNEKFLVSTGSHLAVLYDNVSVLENHHWRSAIACFVESGLVKYITETQFGDFTDLVRSMVLATDISRQQEFLTQLRHFLDTGDCDMAHSHRRHFILQIAIKCADISNPCRGWPVSRLWSLRCCEEFFRQGDAERELGLPLTPFCDRFNVTVAKLQKGFYTLVCEPLYKEWHRFLGSPLSEAMLKNLYSNQAAWEQELVQQELAPAEAPQVPETAAPAPATSFLQTAAAPKLARRLSLPATDPLHRIFDQMIQPDLEVPRGAHLRRNFSLTDRRRSSLLRGLHPRTSLKPQRTRGAARPASACFEGGETGRLAPRPLQQRDNSDNSMEVAAEVCAPLLFTEGGAGEKENACLHASYERLTRRRGSAPSGLVLGERPALGPPSGILRHQHSLSASTRRGSLPTDLLNESLPKQLRNRMIQTPGGGGKRPGLLRRRSMGPELLNLGSQQVMKERQLVQKYLNRPF